jgi:hypothetical protein
LIASHAGPPKEGVHVAGSPLAIHDWIGDPASRQPVEVTDIKSVWSPNGYEKGWIYQGSNGKQYFDENEATKFGKSLQLDTPWGSVGAESPQAGEPHALQRGDVHPDWLVFDGFDPKAKAQMARDGYPSDGSNKNMSPMTVGDTIPDGSGSAKGKTTITDINPVTLGAKTVGWLYSGANGQRYMQRFHASEWNPTIGEGAEFSAFGKKVGVSGEVTSPMLGPVQPFHGSGFPPGSEFHRGWEHGSCLIGGGQPEDCGEFA